MQERINQIKDTSNKKPLEYHKPEGRKEELAQSLLDGRNKWCAVDAVIIHYNKHQQARQDEQYYLYNIKHAAKL